MTNWRDSCGTDDEEEGGVEGFASVPARCSRWRCSGRSGSYRSRSVEEDDECVYWSRDPGGVAQPVDVDEGGMGVRTSEESIRLRSGRRGERWARIRLAGAGRWPGGGCFGVRRGEAGQVAMASNRRRPGQTRRRHRQPPSSPPIEDRGRGVLTAGRGWDGRARTAREKSGARR